MNCPGAALTCAKSERHGASLLAKVDGRNRTDEVAERPCAKNYLGRTVSPVLRGFLSPVMQTSGDSCGEYADAAQALKVCAAYAYNAWPIRHVRMCVGTHMRRVDTQRIAHSALLST